MRASQNHHSLLSPSYRIITELADGLRGIFQALRAQFDLARLEDELETLDGEESTPEEGAEKGHTGQCIAILRNRSHPRLWGNLSSIFLRLAFLLSFSLQPSGPEVFFAWPLACRDFPRFFFQRGFPGSQKSGMTHTSSGTSICLIYRLFTSQINLLKLIVYISKQIF